MLCQTQINRISIISMNYSRLHLNQDIFKPLVTVLLLSLNYYITGPDY